LVGGDFVVSLYRDTVVEDPTKLALGVSIVEVENTGNYLLYWTPDLPGLWQVQVRVVFSGDVYAEEHHVHADAADPVLQDILDQVNKIDLAATIGTAAAETGSLLDRLTNKDGFKTFNQATDSLEAIRDRSG
jgi:hypothetical protein